MEWIRQVSLVRRVMIGFVAMGVIVLLLGGAAAWTVRQLAAGVKLDAEAAAWWFIGCAAAGCGVALLAGWLIRGSIKESVESTVQCVIRIAGGDLETKITSSGKDEISWLRAELNGMRKKLRTMVMDVRQTVESVNTASDEIASGNTDLSNRTEQQASALQQTVSSMAQLAATVSSNSDNTRDARSVVTGSSEIAARGAQTMQDVIVRMDEINTSAGKIAEIIGVIDSIAYQTNILALNAAVEAARAGEQGRGFAVVAEEVRSLAQRSSTAAREIKALIGDSSAKVTAGSKLVADAGRTMREIVDSVGQVASLIAGIAQAGESQGSDIGRMQQAVSKLDTMTQQNATLVEELAASAQSLKGQSERLTEAMSSFRVTA